MSKDFSGRRLLDYGVKVFILNPGGRTYVE